MYVKPFRFLYRASLRQGEDMYEVRLSLSFEGCSAMKLVLITEHKRGGVQIDSNVIFDHNLKSDYTDTQAFTSPSACVILICVKGLRDFS